MPFGLVQLSPDTRTDTWDGCSGYHYDDKTIMGFSHTHLSGTGVGSLGDVLLMPTVGEIKYNVGTPGNGYVSRFSHSQEKAKPGYYSVFLQDPQVNVELTSTTRAGMHRYTFPATKNAHIIVDLVHGIQNDIRDSLITVENKTTISGWRRSAGWGGDRTVYFVLEVSRPCSSIGTEGTPSLRAQNTTEVGGKAKASLNFQTKSSEVILVKVGISATSVEGARKNLKAEIPGWDFDGVRKAAEEKWNQALGSIEVQSSDPHVLRTFYSNMYLSFVAPNTFNDVDGSYFGMDHKVHPNPGFENYSTFSLWDTYRALHPLLTITQPKRVDGMVQSLVQEYKESGYHQTPVWPLWGNETWCMIGYHSVPVITDAYLKGLSKQGAEAAYQAMRETAMQDRFGLDSYRKLGYVASKGGQQATSKTIEYSFDDWCLAKMAESLGHAEDAKMFYLRSANYRNHFDGTTRLLRGRKADGTWRSPFDPLGLVGDEYTEADAWQYLFGAQQDIPGLIDLFGSDQAFVERLDEMFTNDSPIHTGIPDITGLIGQYAQGNEPCHHVAYLYAYAGTPWKTQQRVRQSIAQFFNDTPSGHIGNVDCGQMSAWYVFSSLGFYPANPASGVYIIGSPVVDKAVVHLDKTLGGKTFTVVAENNSPKNIYIQSATLNGKPYPRAWFKHAQLLAGGTLTLVMGPQPNMKWGSMPADKPPTTMPSNFAYPPLPTPSSDKPVVLALPIKVVCGGDEPVGDFVPDPNMLEGSTNQLRAKIDTSAPNAAPAGVYLSERYGSDFTHRFAVPRGKSYTVRLHFAEVFDDGAGMRIENVAINGNQVLKNFDIFAQAGGMRKAVVRAFKGIQPDANGTINIRVTAAPNSPDQNAKISGIEILDRD